MHTVSAAVALLLLAGPAYAQAPDQEAMKKNLDKKLASPFFKIAPWILDYDEAKKASKERERLIFAYFTRSYAN